MKRFAKYLIIAFLIILFVRGFVLSWTTVANDGMLPGIHKDEKIIINKIVYGARFPVTLLSLPFSNDKFLDWIQIPYIRIPGFSRISHNDIICFNYPTKKDTPADKKPIFVKRCVGMPGDTLKISDKAVCLNGKVLNTKDAVNIYRIVTSGSYLSNNLISKYQIFNITPVLDSCIFDACLSREMAAKLKSEKIIRDVRVLRINENNKADLFPQNNFTGWTSDNYGPLLIPGKGITIKLNLSNVVLYRMIIENYEKNLFYISEGKYYVNGVESNSYTFKLNYYFVLDDNRDFAFDSRYWGFLPEDHVIGKAVDF